MKIVPGKRYRPENSLESQCSGLGLRLRSLGIARFFFPSLGELRRLCALNISDVEMVRIFLPRGE